jgi:VIT1/CCC1 family predicted Fe2+/Mn2+ transporter
MVKSEQLPEAVPYEPHVGDSRPYMRDIILGVNDGLVSIFLLVAGVVGGGLDRDQILLAIIAGAIAGAISMGAGEYLATQSQEEVFDREIALERTHIAHHRNAEVDQLYAMFTDMGVGEEDLEAVVAAFSRNDEVLLNSMKVLEFGIIDTERRSPYTAMILSGVLFLGGALPSVLPFLFVDSTALGLAIAAVLTAIGLFAVGAVKTVVTKTNPVKSGLENLIIAGIGGVLAFYIGALVDGAMA